MDGVTTPITIQADGVVVAEATSLEIINSTSSESTEGILNVHFDKQNLPKGVTYQLCLPEGVIGLPELEEGIYQLVNGAIKIPFSVPSTLGPTFGTDGGRQVPDSDCSSSFIGISRQRLSENPSLTFIERMKR